MLTVHQKEQFISQLEEIIKEGLRKLKIVDTLQEKENVLPNLKEKPSEQSIDFDYESLKLEHDKIGWSNDSNTTIEFTTIWWSVSDRLLKKDKDGMLKEVPGKYFPWRRFSGLIPRIQVRIATNNTTNKQELVLIENFKVDWIRTK